LKHEISEASKVDALVKAIRPNRGIYDLVLLDGTQIALPWHACSHAFGLQAQKGEKYVDTDEDTIDPDRTIRIWVRKVNMGLMDGWKFVNDLMNAPNPPQGDIGSKEIPVSQVSTEDWAVLESLLFPGNELNRKSIRDRIAAISGGSR
jgi:hypothetical protein